VGEGGAAPDHEQQPFDALALLHLRAVDHAVKK